MTNNNIKFISNCLIKAFKNMPSEERITITNNTYLCSSALKSKLPKEDYDKLLEMKNPTEWQMAWILLDDELQTEY